jgi:hypothetical protein
MYEGYHALRVDVVDAVGTVTIANPPINLFDFNLILRDGPGVSRAGW